MGGNEHRQMAQTQRLLDRLRNFVQQGVGDRKERAHKLSCR